MNTAAFLSRGTYWTNGNQCVRLLKVQSRRVHFVSLSTAAKLIVQTLSVEDFVEAWLPAIYHLEQEYFREAWYRSAVRNCRTIRFAREFNQALE